MFNTTPWQLLNTDSPSGWILTCMTGIAQCVYANSKVQLTKIETAACYNDPRYLTWRMMTVRIEYDGTLVWYRTDSFWDLYSSVISSSWGPSIKLSTSSESNVDNNGATDLGKTYVFALSDGSGVQLSHLAYSIFGPTAYSAAGTGANTVVTAPSRFYKNVFP